MLESSDSQDLKSGFGVFFHRQRIFFFSYHHSILDDFLNLMAEPTKRFRPTKNSNCWIRGEVTRISFRVESENFAPKLIKFWARPKEMSQGALGRFTFVTNRRDGGVELIKLNPRIMKPMYYFILN